jgi:uncharacterized protein
VNAVFADTSAFLALLNAVDENHGRAARAFETLRARKAQIVTTSYVLVETYALVGRRFGVEAMRSFRATFVPLTEVVWVDEALHNAGLDLLLDRRKRQLSLVDAVSFVTMQRGQLEEAFAFDPHFAQEGFSVLA